MDTYSFGEVVEILKLGQIAIKVDGDSNIGQTIYIDPIDYFLKFLDSGDFVAVNFPPKVTTRSKFVIADRR